MSAAPLTLALSPLTRGEGTKSFLPRPACGERVGVRGRLWRFACSGLAVSALILSLALCGCGKKNAPQPPPDVPNTYPRSYPSE